ncbi:MAG: ribonuclease Z [Planctomycetota bacterium]|nr:ribonuclease Z [Planctomycetota bacterium]
MSSTPLELIVLGAGAALPGRGRGPAGYAVRGGGLVGVTLLDCGPGSIRSLADRGLDLLDIRRVVLSHFHADHVLDLFALAFARRNPNLDQDRLPEVELIGPAGLAELLSVRQAPFDLWTRDPRHRVTEVFPDAGVGLRLERADVVLEAREVQHTVGALGWRVQAPSGASLTYSGDTGETPALAELARGTELLVAECGLALDEAPEMHLNGAAAGRLAAEAGCLGLVLSHFYPHVDPALAVAAAAEAYAGPIHAAVDGTQLLLEPGQAPRPGT